MLKRSRVTISVVIFSLISFYFFDFADLLPKQIHLLPELQFLPALIALNIISLIVIIGLTVLFGRVYCSSICPLGILQDMVDWFAKKRHRKKKYPQIKQRK